MDDTPDRRRPQLIQKVSIVIQSTVLLSVVGLGFQYGQQSQTLKDLVIDRDKAELRDNEMNEKLSALSGQMLQAAGTASVASIEARQQVLEARMDATEQAVKDLRGDIATRFDRLERIVQQR